MPVDLPEESTRDTPAARRACGCGTYDGYATRRHPEIEADKPVWAVRDDDALAVWTVANPRGEAVAGHAAVLLFSGRLAGCSRSCPRA